ncbi:helix-turn-helix domain-containing protein [Bradyrhizobium yuanmingense]|uniref:helix-turn-helix domain-containing protein n=1 Tax=Bradyrhizobium yuanmingense TaxID=108015 RepID=UPI00056A7E2F
MNRKFQGLTEPPQSFIMRSRVEHARTLLESTTQPIKTIARAAGYKDESSFRKLTLMSRNPIVRDGWSGRCEAGAGGMTDGRSPVAALSLGTA